MIMILCRIAYYSILVTILSGGIAAAATAALWVQGWKPQVGFSQPWNLVLPPRDPADLFLPQRVPSIDDPTQFPAPAAVNVPGKTT